MSRHQSPASLLHRLAGVAAGQRVCGIGSAGCTMPLYERVRNGYVPKERELPGRLLTRLMQTEDSGVLVQLTSEDACNVRPDVIRLVV